MIELFLRVMKITRKEFLRKSGLGIAGINLGMLLINSKNKENYIQEYINTKNMTNTKYILKNVLLETGFIYDNDGKVIKTKTDLFSIEIENGQINNVLPNNPSDSNAIDMQGLLMLPSFKDMHIHLDKTYFGGPWSAKAKVKNGVKGMIEFEKEMLPKIAPETKFRANKIIDLLQNNGASFTRSHINIEPTSKLDRLFEIHEVLEKRKDNFEAELVAFPQHGVYYSDSVDFLKEAAKTNIDFIGGVDPYTLDGSIEKTMDFTVQLALENNKGIDIHLHEMDKNGLDTVEYIIKKVNENPALKGKSFLSHCFILAALDAKQQEKIAEQLAEAEIGIISTIPFGRITMPIPTLYKHGVTVYSGNDSITDHWDSFGTGSMLQKANLLAQLYGYTSEYDLSRSLKIATANLLPLNDLGEQNWPKKEDVANLVFVEASCSAEAVARISPVKHLIHKGKFITTI